MIGGLVLTCPGSNSLTGKIIAGSFAREPQGSAEGRARVVRREGERRVGVGKRGGGEGNADFGGKTKFGDTDDDDFILLTVSI